MNKKPKIKHKLNCLFRRNRIKWDLGKSQGLKVIIDCDFDSYLTEKRKQLKVTNNVLPCLNKRLEHQFEFIATGVSAYLSE